MVSPWVFELTSSSTMRGLALPKEMQAMDVRVGALQLQRRSAEKASPTVQMKQPQGLADDRRVITTSVA
jgi:hypothetical protein